MDINFEGHNFTRQLIGEGDSTACYYEQGSGEPVVLVHGGGAGADTLANFGWAIPRLAQERRAIGVDLLGFGGSAKPDPDHFEYSQSARTDHLQTFLDNMDLGPAHLVGSSMGGATCIEVAMRSPDRVKSLTLTGTAGRADEDYMKSTPALRPIFGYDGTESGMREMLDALTAYFVPSDSFVQYRHNQSTRPDVMAAYKSTMAWVMQHGMNFELEDFESLRTLTHVVQGRHDVIVPIRQAMEIVEAIPDSSLSLIGSCGHLPMMEAPDLFCKIVNVFFEYCENRDEEGARIEDGEAAAYRT